MRRIGLAGVLALGLTLEPLAAGAQQTAGTRRVAFVAASLPEVEMTGQLPSSRIFRAFLDGLRERGWAEGQNIIIERKSAEGRPERYPVILQELARLKVDVIVTSGGNLMAGTAKEATATIPAVANYLVDPVGARLVKSLARPGGNITGLTTDAGPGLLGKLLQLLKEAVPRGSRVAMMGRASRQSDFAPEILTAAHALRLTLLPVSVTAPEDVEKALGAIERERPEALLAYDSLFVFPARHRISDWAARQKLPAIATFREFPESGGLLAYGADFADMSRRVATYVDKILKGARPADLPVEQPTKFELVINMKTAKALGLTIPPSVLGRADQVIE